MTEDRDAEKWRLKNEDGWWKPDRILYRADIDKIIERYKKCEYLTKIADDYGVPDKEIRRLIRILSLDEPNWPEVARARNAARMARQAEIEAEAERRAARRVIRAQYVKAPKRPPREEILIRSFEVEVTGEETLFCDTDFLEKIIRKPVKRAAECNPPEAQEGTQEGTGEENAEVPGQEDQDPEKR